MSLLILYSVSTDTFYPKEEMAELKERKLLIVDDQPGIRILLQEVFDMEGIKTFLAQSGKKALEIVQNEDIELVLLDMKIPGMDGLEILRRMNEMGIETKVIMMTAYGELDVMKETERLGALMHFKKPFDIDELRQVVLDYFAGSFSLQATINS